MVHIRHLVAMGIRKGLMHMKKHMAHHHASSHVKSHHHHKHHHHQLGSGAMHRLSDEEREMEGLGMHHHNKHHHRKVKPLHFKF
jgi:hypothetical protein